jgi:hypothetical protein
LLLSIVDKNCWRQIATPKTNTQLPKKSKEYVIEATKKTTNWCREQIFDLNQVMRWRIDTHISSK